MRLPIRRVATRAARLTLVSAAIVASLYGATRLILAVGPGVTATKTFAFIGGDGDGKADPGETVEYTVTVANAGSTAATGVAYNDTIDANTTLVPGSVNASPLAGDDSYETLANTLLEVGVTASGNIAITKSGSLFDNDSEFLGDTFTLKSVESASFVSGSVTSATETAGGSVTVNANGTFVYTPPVGFIGTDHFDYVITDRGPDGILGNADDLTGAGRVTITVKSANPNSSTSRIWYVKNNAPAGGLGRSGDPFDTLVEAQNASAAIDTIYVFQGNGTTAGQNTGITLKDRQTLIGEGAEFRAFVDVNGQDPFGRPPLRVAGTAPLIDNVNAGGHGVTVGSVAGAEIYGLNIAANGNGIDATSGTVEIADVTIRAAGGDGIRGFINFGGSMNFGISRTTITATGNGIDLRTATSPFANVQIYRLDNVVITGNTGGIGINIVGPNAKIAANLGAGAFTAVRTALAIGSPGNGVGGAGIVLTNVAGDWSFSDLDIVADNGAGLSVLGTGAVNVAAGTGLRLALDPAMGTIDATGGPAVSVASATLNLPFVSIKSTNSSTTGLSLTGINDGTTASVFSAGSGSSITNATGTDVVIDSNNADVTYDGTVTDDLGQLISVTNNTGGTKAFAGAITDGNDGDGSGISITGNSNTTVRFSGGLLLSTGANPAFAATGNNNNTTLEVCDENPCNGAATGALVNTITTTTGTALNVANTLIGSGNLEFRSITANGPTNGILLNTTGASGGLKVKGNGGSCTSVATCTGGSIQNTTGDAVKLTSAAAVALTDMFLFNSGVGGTASHVDAISVNGLALTRLFTDLSTDSGILGSTVTNLAITGGTFDRGGLNNSACNPAAADNGTAGGLDGVHITNLLGTSTVTGATFKRSNTRQFFVLNNTNPSGTDDTLTVNNTNWNTHGNIPLVPNPGTSCSGDHLSVSGDTGSRLRLVVNAVGGRNVFKTGGIAVQATGSGSGIVNASISGITNGGTLASGDNNTAAVAVAGTANSVTSFDVFDVQSLGTGSLAIAVRHFSNASFNAKVHDNTITHVAGTGTDAVSVINQGDGSASTPTSSTTGNGPGFVSVTNNVITGNFQRGIFAQSAFSNGSLNLTIDNNTLTATDATGLQAIYVQAAGSGQGSGNDICLNELNNDVSVPAGFPAAYRLSSPGAANCTFAGGCTFALQNFTGNGASNTDLQNWLLVTKSNTASAGAGFTFTTTNPFTTTASCALPVLAMADPVPSRQDQYMADAAPSLASTALVPVKARSRVAPASAVSAVTTAAAVAQSDRRPARPQVAVSRQGVQETDVQRSRLSLRPAAARLANLLSLPRAQASGESIGPIAIGTLPPTKSIIIKYRVTVNGPQLPLGTTQISNQGTVSGSNFANVLTDYPTAPGSADPTVILVDRPDTTVTSLNTTSANPSKAASVTWQIVFANPVQNLTSGNFALVSGGGVTGASITSVVETSGPPATTWNITVNSGSGDGTLGLNLANDTGLSHDVTNPKPFVGQVYTIDRTPPSTTSFNRQTPSAALTNADTLVFRATFSEPVQNVDTADFAVNGTTTATVTNVSPVSTSVYDVTVSGGDLASFNGVVGLNFAGTVTISDLAGNALPSTEPTTDQTYTLDNTAPTITSFTRQSPATSPTNADTLVFRATFSEIVTGVDTADFVKNGTTTATVTLVTPVSGGVYDVTVSGGDLATFNGVVGLDFSASPTIADPTGNAFVKAEPTTDETYTVDNAKPTVTIDQASGQADPTNASSIHFTAVFNEAVTGFATGDVSLSGTAGATTGTVTEITPFNGTTYDVAVSGMTSNGTVIANIAAGVATDAAGNTNIVSDSADNTVTYDSTSPTVTINKAGAQADPTGTSPVNFTVVFSEPVADFANSDVTLSGSAGATTAVVTGGGSTYNVAVSGMTSDGTVVASLAAGIAHDAAGNASAASTSTDNSVIYDTVPPSVTINQAGTQADPTNATTINFTAVFSEPVTGFATGDVTLSGTAGATTGTVTEIAPNNGTTYNVAVSGMTSSGTVIATVPAAVAKDVANQDNTVSTSTDNTVTYDNVPPAVTINQAVGQADPTNTSPIHFTVVFSEPTSDFVTGDVTLSGTANAWIAIVTGGGTTYDVAVSGMSSSGTVIATLASGVAHDAAGNPNAPSISTDNTVTYDNVAPTVTINQAGSQVDPTKNSPIHFTVVFSESVGDFATGDVTLSGTAGATTAVVTGSGTTYDVAVSGMTSDGTVIATLASGVAHDAAGNATSASSSTDNTVTYDTTAPTVTINQAGSQVDPTNASTIHFTVVFSESTVDFATGDVTLGGTAGATTATVTGSGTTYDVAVSGMTGDGTVVATLAAGVASDAAGNAAVASTSSDNTVTYDATAPTVTNVTSTSANGTYALGAVIPVTVTFSEAVIATGTPQLTLETGTIDRAVNYTSGSGTSTLTFAYTVQAGDNSLDLDYVSTTALALNGGTIKDAATNDSLLTLAAPGTAGSLGFGKNLVIDGVVPTVTNVSSLTADGSYTTGAVIPITVSFSESVTVTGTPQLTLETGTTDEVANYTSGSGSSTLIFTYTVQSGDNTPDLDYVSTTALALNGGTIKDAATNNATLTLAAPGTTGSLGFGKAIVIDAVAPDTTINSTPANPTNSASAGFTFSGTDNVTAPGSLTFECKVDTGAFAACTSPKTFSPGLADGSHTFQVRAIDGVGNVDPAPASFTWVVDTTPPTVLVSSATTSPTNVSPITITITFSEPVTGFTPTTASGDIVIGGVGGTDSNPQTVSPTTYTFALAPSGQGAVTVTVPSGRAADAATNTNTVSNTFSITYDTVAPTVTINQKTSAPAQADPTNNALIHFTAVFSEAVTGFTGADVALSGTAGATTASVTGGPTTYDVAVGGMSVSGTVIVTIPASTATDLAGNANTASTSTDNTVSYIARPRISDFNGDGKADIAIYNKVTREVRLWNTTTSPAHSDVSLGIGAAGARVVGLGDYDGNSKSDLLWYNGAAGGSLYLWLNQTSTVTSLATAVPAGARVFDSGDYNGDGASDVLWFNPTTGDVTLWLSVSGSLVTGRTVASIPHFSGWTSAWTPVASGDYDNDGRSDIFWQNGTTQATRIWFMNGGSVTTDQASGTFALAGWRVVGTGNYNTGDSNSDVIWHQIGQSTPRVWTMSGASQVESATDQAKGPGPFEVVGSGDYDASGTADILWRNRATGQIDLWLMGGTGGNSVLSQLSVGTPTPAPGANWFVLPARTTGELSDFNNDGQSDLVWQNDSVGSAVLWYLNGPSQIGSAALANQPAPTWIIGGVGDFNGDGQVDIVAYSSNGSVIIAFMNGNTVTSTQVLPIAAGGGWFIRGVADVNGDGQSDLIWQFQDGRIAYWLMNGGATVTVGPTGYIYGVALGGWRVAGAADLNGDGQTDLILQYQDGQVAYWLLNGTTVGPTGFIYNLPIGGWSVRGAADLNADGSPDLVWQYLDGRVAYWLLNGTTVGTTGYIFNSPVSGWTIRGVR